MKRAKKRGKQAKKRVLVVDDSRVFREFISELVEMEGLVAETAEDGAEALELLREGEAYDLVISDVEMPRVNGIELVKVIGRVRPLTKVILVTGNGTGHVSGVEAVFPKPFDVIKLMEEVRAALEPGSKKGGGAP